MFKIRLVVLFVFVTFGEVLAQKAFSLSGKLRVLNPLEIRLESLKGDILFSQKIGRDGLFASETLEIVPDIYILWIGTTRQPIYLTNTGVTVKGYYDEKNPDNSALNFTGIDDYLALLKWVPEPRQPVAADVKGQLRGTMYSALAYLADSEDHEMNKMLLDQVPAADRETLSARWLGHRVDSLSRFAVGAQAFDFEYVDRDGNMVRLSDFRGKLVVVDFWASWCGPCRQEMKNLLPVYNELKGVDLEFISISLDNREKDWRRMLDVEDLPWVMLWNQEGFTAGNEPNAIQKAYGFYSIPFILLIDKQGRILARDIRGEQVKQAIQKAREEN